MIRVEERPDRVVVTLDRPDKHDAIDADGVDALHDVCAAVERDPRLLLLTGAGGIFAAGADIAQLRERGRLDALAAINSGLFSRVAALPMPTLAAVDASPAAHPQLDLLSQAVLFEDDEKRERMTRFLQRD